MGGLLDFLSPALTVATQAAGAQQAGEAQKAATDQANTLKMIAQLRQQHEDEQKDLLTRAQIGNLNSESKARLAPAAKPFYTIPGKGIGHVDENGNFVVAPGGEEAAKAAAPTTRNTSNGIEQWNPATSKWELQTDSKTGKPLMPFSQPPSNTYITGVGAPGSPNEGKPTIFAGTSKGPPKLVDTNVGKPESQTNPMGQIALARTKGGLNDMEFASTQMPEFERRLRDGSASLTGLDQFTKDVGNSFNSDGVKADAARAIALTRLNKTNPELARYVRLGLKYAEGESMMTQRPSDFRTKMAAFLATAPTGDYTQAGSPMQQMLDDIAAGREAQVKAMRQSIGGPTYVRPGTKPASGTLPPISKAAYDKAIAAGHTDAEIRAQYTVPQ